jgi:cytochrome c553
MKKIALILVALSSLYLTASVNYQTCAGCHGQTGGISALGGASKIIKNMSKEEIVSALTGYQNGTYGGSMAMIMKGQVAGLNEEQIKELATIIDSFE